MVIAVAPIVNEIGIVVAHRGVGIIVERGVGGLCTVSPVVAVPVIPAAHLGAEIHSARPILGAHTATAKATHAITHETSSPGHIADTTVKKGKQ